jgi:hypothetical protein
MPEAVRKYPNQVENLLADARQKAGLSKTSAAEMLYIDRRRLVSYENTVPPADVILSMSEAYGDPSLPERYCSELCPIGLRYHTPVEVRDLATAVLGVLKEHHDVEAIRNRLVEIAEDGTISQTEQADFEQAMTELLELGQRIEALKLWATQHLNKKERGEAA